MAKVKLCSEVMPMFTKFQTHIIASIEKLESCSPEVLIKSLGSSSRFLSQATGSPESAQQSLLHAAWQRGT